MPLAAVLETRDRSERRTSMRDTQATAAVQTEGFKLGKLLSILGWWQWRW